MFDFSNSNLYCSEDAEDDSGRDVDLPPSTKTTDSSSEDDYGWISASIKSEIHHMPAPDLSLIDVTARGNAVEWILKVHQHYRFHPVTACVSVNYLDRFLSSYSLPSGDWVIHLLSIACLSLAVKMEETDVHLLLLDFQLFEPRFVFDPHTIQRMELCVMAKLKWRLRAITPFDFVDCFARKFGSSDLNRLFSRASYIILNTLPVVDFLDYRPSTLAAAAVLYAAQEISDISVRYDENAGGILSELLSKDAMEMVSPCQQQMKGLAIDTCQNDEPEAAPRSPIGVLDVSACGSWDSQNSGSDNNRASSSVEPCNKRRKLI
ncbi:hypothetical protein MRB53_012539 [Persea americana]|uniref:Uncharacterized protein n=1 Tax=Persea americana TaxID=3435 RepID=A0ACC2LXX9_PERAE|nr:hypothetical protein MRB53_012539 [Persea americana]|eukprot:TRINITY_DN6283_c3_g1_i2.p1 TRINITY_DN6283_c3_g1~~TRINITY_DN6283_c3_g1_i2.p1  ORF type:complete len:320 (+),score=48.60 TRINITY_DN6283_c3_g1_i2:145-1104(+)